MRGVSPTTYQRGWFSDAWNKVSSAVSSAVDKAKEVVGNAIDKVKEAKDTVAQSLNDTIHSVVDKAKEIAGNVVDKVKDMLGLKQDEPEEDEEDDEPEDEEDDEGDELSDPEKFFGESFPKDDSFGDEDGWPDDPDAQDWMAEDEPYEDDPEDDELPEEEDPSGEEGNPDEEGMPEDGYPDEENPDGENPEGENPEQETPDDTPSDKDPTASTSTPMSPSNPPEDRVMQLKPNEEKKYGWENIKAEPPHGAIEVMMHDGDQQFLNPYGRHDAAWTVYSFRPCDTQGDKHFYPQIAITPASFESIKSMKTMLNNIPYVVVKEYFFKNTASTMMNFVQKIMGMAKEAFQKPNPGDNPQSTDNQKSAQGSEGTKSTGNGIIDKVKEKFQEVTLEQATIDIPYILYCGLRQKLYGNTYVFPYIVESSTQINNSSNDAEWGDKGGMMQFVKDMIQGAVSLIGDMSAGLLGSQAQTADLFPAPTWSNKNTDKVKFAFDLILINDHVIKTRNNYMCVNTIIHNNRSMQKAILAFPGALYEVWLPTGQRHLMCTGSFTLFPLGLNRKVPKDFFVGNSKAGAAANFRIGSTLKDVSELKNPKEGESKENPKEAGHVENVEVIPDAYKLQVQFTSCLANNLNTSVFQYYVKMTGYENYGDTPKPKKEGEPDEPTEAEKKADALLDNPSVKNAKTHDQLKQEEAEKTPSQDSGEPAALEMPGGTGQQQTPHDAKRSVARSFARAVQAVAEDDTVETFNESTYNKKLEKLRSRFGDQAINSDSVVMTVKKTQGVIRQSNEFLSKLYNANKNNLWYKEDVTDEIYTTFEPDHRKMLRKKYQSNLATIRGLDSRIKEQRTKIGKINERLSNSTNLEKRTPLLAERVRETKTLNELLVKRDNAADEALKIDADLIRMAFDEQDKVVSVKKNGMTFKIFEQAWNEKIMNSYEKDKLQYLTSAEKERYFEDKVRELRKYDNYGVLNHPDWFFRVVVLDFITREMRKLIFWFKNCSFDDFDTIYKIMRKLNLLHLDVDAIRSDDQFDINRTNLFYLSEDDMKEFTKVDGMLTGNTLYQLFMNQVKLNFVERTSSTSQSSELDEEKSRELVQEQESEVQNELRKKVRQDVVTRVWGSETELTKAAFQKANEAETTQDSIPQITYKNSKGEDVVLNFSNLKELKDRIITLKLIDKSEDQEIELRELLGAFTNLIGVIKEGLVIEEMNKMSSLASEEIGKKDDSVNAKVM